MDLATKIFRENFIKLCYDNFLDVNGRIGVILFHRSPAELIKDGYIGYGFSKINFSEYENSQELLAEFKIQYPKRSKSHNMVKNFFNLRKGDIVIVPIFRAITIAIVSGEKRYILSKKDSSNQVKVNYLKDKQGDIIKIPRYKLKTSLQSLLKSRRTSVLLKEIYAKEIATIIDQINLRNSYDPRVLYKQQIRVYTQLFKKNLLKKIQQQKIHLKAGGFGLEELIKELFEIKGYKAKICTKNQSRGVDDIDVIATKDDETIIVQVKHHSGTSNQKGIIQLKEYKINDNALLKKLLITTADNINEIAEKLADENDIRVMLGKELVDWIYESLPKLSRSVKEKLGIFESYQLIDN